MPLNKFKLTFYKNTITKKLFKQQCNNNDEQGLTSFKNKDNNMTREQMCDYAYLTPANNKDRNLFVVNESVKITETGENSVDFDDDFSCETKSVDNLKSNLIIKHKPKLSVDFESMAFQRVDQISEKSELSSSSSQAEPETPFKRFSLKKNKKYYNFLNTFQENLPSPEPEKRNPMIKIDITNNYINNNLDVFKTQKEEDQSENWFVKGIFNLLGCGCGGSSRVIHGGDKH